MYGATLVVSWDKEPVNRNRGQLIINIFNQLFNRINIAGFQRTVQDLGSLVSDG